jgi:hypothetical protein
MDKLKDLNQVISSLADNLEFACREQLLKDVEQLAKALDDMPQFTDEYSEASSILELIRKRGSNE